MFIIPRSILVFGHDSSITNTLSLVMLLDESSGLSSLYPMLIGIVVLLPVKVFLAGITDTRIMYFSTPCAFSLDSQGAHVHPSTY